MIRTLRNAQLATIGKWFTSDVRFIRIGGIVIMWTASNKATKVAEA